MSPELAKAVGYLLFLVALVYLGRGLVAGLLGRLPHKKPPPFRWLAPLRPLPLEKREPEAGWGMGTLIGDMETTGEISYGSGGAGGNGVSGVGYYPAPPILNGSRSHFKKLEEMMELNYDMHQAAVTGDLTGIGKGLCIHPGVNGIERRNCNICQERLRGEAWEAWLEREKEAVER